MTSATSTNNYSFTVRSEETTSVMISVKRVMEILTSIAHGFIFGVTIYIFILCCIAGFNLFTWHPLLLTFGFFLLTTEAVLVYSNDNILTRKFSLTTRVNIHRLLTIVGGVLMLSGFIVIIVNKCNNDFKHFQSSHSQFGLSTIIFAVVAAIGGNYGFFKNSLLYKFIHNIFGIVTFVLGSVTFILSFYTGWFEYWSNTFFQVVCVILVIYVAAITVINPIIAALRRLNYLLK